VPVKKTFICARYQVGSGKKIYVRARRTDNSIEINIPDDAKAVITGYTLLGKFNHICS